MTELARPEDWIELEELSKTVSAVSQGYLKSLRARFESGGPGQRRVLVLGRPRVVDSLLVELIGGPAAEAGRATAGPVLVVGRGVDLLDLPLVQWPRITSLPDRFGHIFIIRRDAPPSAVEMEVFATTGFVDLALIVTPLSQPLATDDQRRLAAASQLAALCRVVVVSLPGEEFEPEDEAEIKVYVNARLQATGWSLARRLETRILKVAQPARADEELLAVPSERLDAASLEFARANLERVFTGIERSIDLADRPRSIPADEARELLDLAASHLRRLGHRMQRMSRLGEIRTTEQAQRFLVDVLNGWRVGADLEAALLDRIASFRPEIGPALVSKAREASESLVIAETAAAGAALPARGSSWTMSDISRVSMRIVVGVLAAAVAYLLVSLILQEWLAVILAAATGVAVGLLGPAGLLTVRRAKREGPEDPQVSGEEAGPLRGWPLVEQHLLIWLGERLMLSGEMPTDICARLRQRFGLPGSSGNGMR